MSFANRYNKGSKFDVNTQGFNYKKLADLEEGEIFVLKGLYINYKGTFGPSPVAILADCFVNLPMYTLSTVADMIADEMTVETIKEGHAGFSVEHYTDKNGIDRLGVRWEDVD